MAVSLSGGTSEHLHSQPERNLLMYSRHGSPIMANDPVRRTVFISYDRGDHDEIERFIDDFRSVFIPRASGVDDNDNFIDDANADYVMNQIREKCLLDSTVTIVLLGKCTHSRRHVDWEIKSSLRQGASAPNGLIGIVLPSQGRGAFLPPRFEDNWINNRDNCYARYYSYPTSQDELRKWIEDAHKARTARANLIVDSRSMMKRNIQCRICGVTH